MKHFISVIAIFTLTTLFSRLSAQQITLAPVLTDYYNIKDALVSNDAKVTAEKAAGFLKDVTNINRSAIPAKDHMAFMALKDKLAYDARHISESSDINHQREHFASLTTNMASLAKQATLTDKPVYQEYCPMKKTTWLSNETAIKNPYYGSSNGGNMLTCGTVNATIKH